MYSFGILMDPIDQIDINKDSTIAIAKALQNKCKVYYIIPDTLHINNSKVYAKTAELKIYKNKKPFYEINNARLKELSFLDCILFRLDPPVDEHYIQVTHILDIMESQGVLVINSPQSIRDFNEKNLIHQIKLESARNWYDTCLEDHHHFYNSKTQQLIDIKKSDISLKKYPSPPNGFKIKKYDVIIEIE